MRSAVPHLPWQKNTGPVPCLHSISANTSNVIGTFSLTILNKPVPVFRDMRQERELNRPDPQKDAPVPHNPEYSLTPHTMNTAPDIPYSLVIPAYNEENRIRNLFDTIGRFDGELIVVCDGTDGTARVIEEITRARTDLTIRCLTFDHRLGKGGGVIAGLSAARAPLVGFCDADGSTTMSEMLRLFSSLGSNDGAIGSRWVDGSTLTVRQGLMRRLESRRLQPFNPVPVRAGFPRYTVRGKGVQENCHRQGTAGNGIAGI